MTALIHLGQIQALCDLFRNPCGNASEHLGWFQVHRGIR